jgi:E3 ubiquitin-protein ligase HERC2
LRNVVIAQVACGGLHTAVLDSTGKVQTFGLGKDGRLGHGAVEVDELSPRLVQGLADHVLSQVDCGGHHTAALTSTGVVYTFGFDDDGRLGHGSSAGHQFFPRVVEALLGEEIAQVACGCWHSAALSTAGAVFTFGSCKSGQLGGGAKNTACTPRAVLQGKGGGIVSIACGTAHTAAVTASGELYTWGKHADGRLGYVNAGEVDQSIPQRVEALDGKVVRQVACGVYDTGVVVGGPPVSHAVAPLSLETDDSTFGR